MRTVVSGVVDAPTEPGAMVAVEGIVEATLGLAIALDLCSMLTPLAGSGATLFLDISPHDPAIPARLNGVVSAGVSGAIFRVAPSLATAESDALRC
jgi:hypothetical protein